MRKRQLSSSASKHTAAGQAAFERIAGAADRVVQLTRDGNCKAALTAYGALERLYGEAFAHAQSGGHAQDPIGHALRAEAILLRSCVVSPPKLARGTTPPMRRRTLPMLPVVSLKGRKKARR